MAYLVKDSDCKVNCSNGFWQLSNVATALGYFAQFVVMIWGSAVIFGK